MLASLLAMVVGAAALEEERPLISINWYLHLDCEGCSHLGLDLGDGVTVLAPAKSRVFLWTYYWKYPSKLQIGEVFAAMAQKTYKVVLMPAEKTVWITPWGLAFQEPPPYPKWHGQEVAPDEFTGALVAWFESHDLVATDAEKQFEMLRWKRSVSVHLQITIKQAEACGEQSVGREVTDLCSQYRALMLGYQKQRGGASVRARDRGATGEWRAHQSRQGAHLVGH
jgi:hypothetical protein